MFGRRRRKLAQDLNAQHDAGWDEFVASANDTSQVPDMRLRPMADPRIEAAVELLPRIERALVDLAISAERLDGRVELLERKLEVADEHVRLIADGSNATRSEVASLRELTVRVQEQVGTASEVTDELRSELASIRDDRAADRETVAELHGSLRAARLAAERARQRSQGRLVPISRDPQPVAPVTATGLEGDDPSEPVAILHFPQG